MGSLNGFLEHMDWFQLFLLLIGAVACLFCITFHELAHGFAAYQLGDPTAKVNGRLTLNPISHIDWIGLMLLLTVRVGWAKPVPVDMLDGSKILFALLPDRIYYQYLRYERFFILAVVLLAWMGVFSVPLSFCMEGIVRGLCAVTAFPFQLAQYYFF